MHEKLSKSYRLITILFYRLMNLMHFVIRCFSIFVTRRRKPNMLIVLSKIFYFFEQHLRQNFYLCEQSHNGDILNAILK